MRRQDTGFAGYGALNLTKGSDPKKIPPSPGGEGGSGGGQEMLPSWYRECLFTDNIANTKGTVAGSEATTESIDEESR